MLCVKRIVMMLCVLGGVFGCADDDVGNANVNVNVAGLTAADVTSVKLTISGNGMSTVNTTLVKVGSTWQGLVGALPVGTNRTFKADAYDASNTIVYAGSVTGVQIKANQTVGVTLLLQEVAPPPPFGNSAPRITSLWLSSDAPATDDTVDVLLGSMDPDNDATMVEWATTGGSLVMTAGGARFSAAVDGDYTITAKVTDAKGASDSISVTLAVRASNARGSASVTATVNTFPRVVNITSTAGRLAPGAAAEFVVNGVDPDGDAMLFAFNPQPGCPGTTTSLASGPTWVRMRFQLAVTATNISSCTFKGDALSAVASRPGTGSGFLTIAVADAPEPEYAPIVDSTFQSSLTADHGEEITLRVSGHAHDGGAVSIDWTLTGNGALSSSNGEATWTAPGCYTGPTATITATITDVEGNWAVVTFTVDPVASSCVAPGLIAHWDGGSADLVGGRALSTSIGAPASAVGYRGTGYSFDGASGLRAPSTGLPLAAEPRTVELWFLSTASPAWGEGSLVTYGIPDGGQLFALGTLSGNQPFFSQWGGGTSGSSVSHNTWHHVAAAFDGQRTWLYVDGQLAGSGVFGVNTVDSGFLTIGYLESSRRFAGVIDEVRVYDRALSPTEIKNIHAGYAY